MLDPPVFSVRYQLSVCCFFNCFTLLASVTYVSIQYNYIVLLAVWLSGNALASINVVALRQTRLVLGWVTVCGRVNHFGM